MVHVTLKGGKGSGDHNHLGRPGMVGGSEHSNGNPQTDIDGFARKHYQDTNEWGMCITRDNIRIHTTMGTPNGVSIPYEVGAQMSGGIYTHTHPVDMPPSPEDVALAIHLNLKEMNVVANDGGHLKTYTVRPQAGAKWPTPDAFKWNMVGVRDEMKRFNNADVAAGGRQYWNKFWELLCPRMSMEYKVQ